MALVLGFSVSAVSAFGVVAVFGTGAMGELDDLRVVQVGTAVLLGVLLVSDLTRHTITWHRQTPRHLYFRYGVAKAGLMWGLDTGLVFTTVRVTSLSWALLILTFFGFAPWWIGGLYAVGFCVPFLLIVSVLPWRPGYGRTRGEPGWISDRLIRAQPVARYLAAMLLASGAATLILGRG